MKPSASNSSNDRITISKASLNNDLIEFVRTNRVLYDFKDPHYTSIEIKNQRWQTFADRYGIQVTDVKQRWNILRTGFSYAKKRLENGLLKGKKWEYLDSMMFLKDFLKPNDHLQITLRRSKNFNGNTSQQSNEIEMDEEEEEMPQFQQELFEDPISVESNDSNDQQRHNHHSTLSNQIYDHSIHTSHSIHDDILYKRFIEDMRDPKVMFLKSLLPSLSKYTDEQLNIVKYRLLGVIIEADKEFKS